MARTLTISIHTGDWYIDDGLDGYHPDDFPMFANIDFKDGKIHHIHDYLIWDTHIQEASEFGKSFLEECIFIYEDISFKGTFIDAFLFIQKELENKGEKYVSKDNE